MTKSPKLAFIKAKWHSEIVDEALLGFNQRLDQLQVLANVDVFDVPGAFELPLLAQNLANTVEYDAIIAAAFVVDGGIYRHDFVAQAVITGLMEVGTRTGVPVLSVSLRHTIFSRQMRTLISLKSILSRKERRLQMRRSKFYVCMTAL